MKASCYWTKTNQKVSIRAEEGVDKGKVSKRVNGVAIFGAAIKGNPARLEILGDNRIAQDEVLVCDDPKSQQEVWVFDANVGPFFYNRKDFLADKKMVRVLKPGIDLKGCVLIQDNKLFTVPGQAHEVVDLS